LLGIVWSAVAGTRCSRLTLLQDRMPVDSSDWGTSPSDRRAWTGPRKSRVRERVRVCAREGTADT